jgi:hypothetical protein
VPPHVGEGSSKSCLNDIVTNGIEQAGRNGTIVSNINRVTQVDFAGMGSIGQAERTQRQQFQLL